MKPPERAGRLRQFKLPYRRIVQKTLLRGATFECLLECGHRIERTGWLHYGRWPRLRTTGAKCRACAIEATAEAFGDVDYRIGSTRRRVPASRDTAEAIGRGWRLAALSSGASE